MKLTTELDKIIEPSFEIHPICIPKKANDDIANRVGVQAWVSGYGSKPEKKSTDIHYAKLAIMGQKDCENKHYGNLDTPDSEFTRKLRNNVKLILNSVKKIASEILCTRASIEELGTCPGGCKIDNMFLQIIIIFDLEVDIRRFNLHPEK